jgi:hypothetical protein
MIDRISADDACPLCGYWTCRCNGFVLAGAVTAAAPSDSDPDMDEALRRARQGR